MLLLKLTSGIEGNLTLSALAHLLLYPSRFLIRFAVSKNGTRLEGALLQSCEALILIFPEVQLFLLLP